MLFWNAASSLATLHGTMCSSISAQKLIYSRHLIRRTYRNWHCSADLSAPFNCPWLSVSWESQFTEKRRRGTGTSEMRPSSWSLATENWHSSHSSPEETIRFGFQSLQWADLLIVNVDVRPCSWRHLGWELYSGNRPVSLEPRTLQNQSCLL
jgi:hypothetical protein